MKTKPSSRLHDTFPPKVIRKENNDWYEFRTRSAEKVTKILDQYQPITLQEMSGFNLLNRTDTKFVFDIHTLNQVLNSLPDSYRVLQIEDHRLHTYQNLYFDTPQLDMFVQHHRQQRDRYKVRCRFYVDTQGTFLEVKKKNNRDRTIKNRMETSNFVEELPHGYEKFLHRYDLKPVLWNDFQRMTLVSNGSIERLTLDINLGFSDGWGRMGLPRLVIAEVKQDTFTIHSNFMSKMRKLGVQPRRFSKYCIGIPQFYPQVKSNRFKPRELLVERIIHDGD
jgi:hypothetical protein